jgi:hypothetical protein
MSRRRIALLSIVTLSVIVVTVLSLQFSLAMYTVEISSADITYRDPLTAIAVFNGIGEYYVQPSYLNSSVYRECVLQVSFDLYSGSKLNSGLYTKSITLKLTNAWVSTLAFGVSTYTEPPTEYKVDYGYEPPATRSVTINTPIVSPGGTWTFTVYIYNPPTVNGKLLLNLGIGALVIENHFLGRTYDLRANLQIPAVS